MDQAAAVEVPAAAQTNPPSDSVAALETVGAALEATDVESLQAAQVDQAALDSLQQDHIDMPVTLSNQDGMPSNGTALEASALVSRIQDLDDRSSLTQAVIPGQEAQAQSSNSLVQPSKPAEPAPDLPGADLQPAEISDPLPREDLDTDPASAATDFPLQASSSSSPSPDETDESTSYGMQPDPTQPLPSPDTFAAEAPTTSGNPAASVDPTAALATTREDAEADGSAISKAAAAEVPSMGPDGSMLPAERAPDLPVIDTSREAGSGVNSIVPASVPEIEQVKVAARTCMDVPLHFIPSERHVPPEEKHQPIEGRLGS